MAAMNVRDFDEKNLLNKLTKIPLALRVAFATACAERVVLCYGPYAKERGIDDYSVLRSALNGSWNFAAGKPFGPDLDGHIERCLALVPDENDYQIPGAAYADDAAAAITYAAMAVKTGDPQDAAWAARRSYEALEHYVIELLQIDLNDPQIVEKVLRHHLVQAELQRQERDLAELLTAGPDARPTVLAIRARAKEDAKNFFRLDD